MMSKSSRRKSISALIWFQLVVAVVAVGVTILAATQIGPLIERKTELEDQVSEIEEKIGRKQAELEIIRNEITMLQPLAKEGLGYSYDAIAKNPEIPEGSLRAYEEAQAIVSQSDRSRRNNITILLWSKKIEEELNAEIIVPSLKRDGFRVKRQYSELQQLATNAIWFGKNVHAEDVKIVALRLIAAGLEIKGIRPSKLEGRDNVIQIGADGGYINLPVISTEDVVSTSDFSRFRPSNFTR